MIIRNRIKYWNCCKFADWIRGEKKPEALTMEDWKIWKQKQQKEKNSKKRINTNSTSKITNQK